MNTGTSREKISFVKWIQKGEVNRRLCIVTFMLAPLMLLLVFTYIPFLKMFQFSFYDMKYIGDYDQSAEVSYDHGVEKRRGRSADSDG